MASLIRRFLSLSDDERDIVDQLKNPSVTNSNGIVTGEIRAAEALAALTSQAVEPGS